MKQIRVYGAFRIGPKSHGRHRFIPAKFNVNIGRTIVLDHIKNLDKNKGFGVNEQPPRELGRKEKETYTCFQTWPAREDKSQMVQ